MKNRKAFGNIILLLTSIIWGLAFVFQRTGMDSIEPITFNAARMSAGALFVGIAVLIRDGKNKNKPQDPVKQKEINKNTWLGGVGCGLFLTAASIVQQMGLVYTTAGKAGFITAMYMLFVPIFNLIIFKKNNGLKVWIAVITGIVGMYLLCVRDDFVLTMGDLLILACAILFAGHILCCDNFAPKSDPIKMSAIQFIITGVLSWIFAFITESPSIEKIVSATIPILYCGVISGALGYTLQIVGQRYTDPSTASLLMSLESVFAVIAGVLLLNETMVFQEILGCIIMFAAIILLQLPSRPKKQK